MFQVKVKKDKENNNYFKKKNVQFIAKIFDSLLQGIVFHIRSKYFYNEHYCKDKKYCCSESSQ